MKRLKIVAVLGFALLCLNSHGQELSNLNNFPYSVGFVNPAYVGNNNVLELDLNFKKQWYGIEDSPEVGSLLFHIPVSNKLTLGVNLENDKRGLLNTLKGEGIFAYKVPLGDNSNLGFGLTYGVGKTTIDVDQIQDLNDPALANIADNSFSMEGKFGMYYQIKKFEIGFTLPKLFRPNFNSVGFGEIVLEPLNYTHSFIRTTIQINQNLAFEPWINLRTYDNFDTDYQFLGLLHLKEIMSFGASYRGNNGIAFYLGFNINKKVRTSYSYELSNSQVPGFNQGTHEFQVALLLGEKSIEDAEEEVVEEEPEEIIEEEAEVTEDPIVEEPEEEIEEQVEEPEVKQVEAPRDSVQKQTQPVVEPVQEEPEQEIVEEAEVEEPAAPKDPLDFEPGNYLVVGVFKSENNANSYNQLLISDNHSSFLKLGKDTQLYYVILESNEDLNALKARRTSVRQSGKHDFRNAWILSIE